MGYRDSECIICREHAVLVCPRCDARTCEGHGVQTGEAPNPWCSLCERERQELMALNADGETIRAAGVPKDDRFTRDPPFAHLLLHALSRPFRRRRARREADAEFRARSRDDIARWRAPHDRPEE